MNLGPMEILIIAVVIVLLFGARKMPAMARSLGQSMRILKAETKGMKEDDADAAPVQQPQQLPQAHVSPPKVAPSVDQAQVNKNAS